MRTFLLSLAMVVATAPAVLAGDEESPLDEAILALKDAFTEEGLFDTDAREALMEAHDILVDLRDELGDLMDEKAMAVMGLESLTMYNLACLDALDGDADGAIEWLEGAVGAGYTDADWMAEDPDLESLHGDPRFEALLQDAYEMQEQTGMDWMGTSGSCEDCDEDCGPGSNCGCGCSGD
jgi:hypothetical protein